MPPSRGGLITHQHSRLDRGPCEYCVQLSHLGKGGPEAGHGTSVDRSLPSIPLQRRIYSNWRWEREASMVNSPFFFFSQGSSSPFPSNSWQFQIFADKILGQPELGKDIRFSTNNARVANRELLVKIITDTLMQKALNHWLRLFEGLG